MYKCRTERTTICASVQTAFEVFREEFLCLVPQCDPVQLLVESTSFIPFLTRQRRVRALKGLSESSSSARQKTSPFFRFRPRYVRPWRILSSASAMAYRLAETYVARLKTFVGIGTTNVGSLGSRSNPDVAAPRNFSANVREANKYYAKKLTCFLTLCTCGMRVCAVTNGCRSCVCACRFSGTPALSTPLLGVRSDPIKVIFGAVDSRYR